MSDVTIKKVFGVVFVDIAIGVSCLIYKISACVFKFYKSNYFSGLIFDNAIVIKTRTIVNMVECSAELSSRSKIFIVQNVNFCDMPIVTGINSKAVVLMTILSNSGHRSVQMKKLYMCLLYSIKHAMLKYYYDLSTSIACSAITITNTVLCL